MGKDDDNYSSSDDSSKRNIPGSVAKEKRMSVRDELTVDSYALRLAEKKRATRERDFRDDRTFCFLMNTVDEYLASKRAIILGQEG